MKNLIKRALVAEKRFIFIFAATMLVVNVMAENAIQNTFWGLKLGRSTQNEFQKVLYANDIEYQTDTAGVYVFQCNWEIEGVPVKHVVSHFLDDTLMMMIFVNACENKCDSLEKIIDKNVEKRYGLLQCGDSSAFIKMFSQGLVSFDAEQWSRIDDETSFMYAKSDSGYFLVYLAEKFIWNKIAQSYIQSAKATDPDYAEENKVTGVAGVKFGDGREYVRKVIYDKAQKLLDSDSHSLKYYKVKVGGLTYDFATFYFAPGKGLVSVNLQSSFFSWRKEEAIMAYENVVSQYKHKYTNFKVIKDEPEQKASACGAYIEGYNSLPILITFHKGLSRGGDIMYYVQVDYYHSRTDGMYDDEI